MEEKRQLVITTVAGRRFLSALKNNKLYDVVAEDSANLPSVGNIYVGKVQNIVHNIHAAFVEVQKGILCYLPLSECSADPVRCGDEMVVQIRKAAVKTKQAVVTRYPELVGHFCVVSTGDNRKGVSKKITEPEERERLYGILSEFEKEEYGLVIRTAAAKETSEAVKEECRMLLEKLHKVMEGSRYKTCFSKISADEPFYVRYLKDSGNEKIDRIVTDDRECYETLTQMQPFYQKKQTSTVIDFYEDKEYSLDKMFGISSKIKKALEKRVWMKSGANIVIEPTEALTVIDVNSGKAVEGKKDKEKTFFEINCEAAEEAVRQIRIRNISGIILIDFIDMKKEEHKYELLQILREYLQRDRIRTVLVDITKLGLVEITRMKMRAPLSEVMKELSI